MTSDLFTIRNGDGASIGPLGEGAIAAMISQGQITADAFMVMPQGLIPITQRSTFVAALVRVEGPGAPRRLFTGDLTLGGGEKPLKGEEIDPALAKNFVSLDLPPPQLVGTIDHLFGKSHGIIDSSFAGVLSGMWMRGMTGVLEVEAGEIRTTIYVLDGMPMFAADGALEDTLGQLMIRTGAITEEQLDRAIEHYLLHYEGTNKRVGEVLVELGMCTTDQISDALHIQTREKIVRCFEPKEPRFRLERDAEAVKRMPRFACSVRTLLEEGLSRHYDQERLEQVALCAQISPEQIVDALLGELKRGSPAPDDDDDGALEDAFDLDMARVDRAFTELEIGNG